MMKKTESRNQSYVGHFLIVKITKYGIVLRFFCFFHFFFLSYCFFVQYEGKGLRYLGGEFSERECLRSVRFRGLLSHDD